jgi:DNA invertase Pin-like site-specific DNA recombinase
VPKTKRAALYLRVSTDGQTTENQRGALEAGRMFFHITGAFAEFEREMIRSRVNAGLTRAKARGVKLGRPKVGAKVEAAIRKSLAAGVGILKDRRTVGVGSGI